MAPDRLRVATAPFSKAALFDLAGQGYDSLFEQLVACLILDPHLRRGQSTHRVALFAAARTPEAMRRLSIAQKEPTQGRRTNDKGRMPIQPSSFVIRHLSFVVRPSYPTGASSRQSMERASTSRRAAWPTTAV